MKFLIISHTIHKQENNLYYAYAPYVREMNLWLRHVSSVTIVAPVVKKERSNIDINYLHKNIKLNEISSIEFTSIKKSMSSIFKIPLILLTIFKACREADHIHLRCPGNIGLLGCLVQICFPKKIKTTKYAGNWNPKSNNQPMSYKIQRWILNNTFITKNMKVLVYGEWVKQSKNIKSFFTATFKNEDRQKLLERKYNEGLQFVFIGSLVKGKRPLLAIKIIEQLKNKGVNVKLDLFGDGILKNELQKYIDINNLKDIIVLKGNQDIKIIKESLKKAHFSILPSKSEGWPKAIAESMFFGAIPIATSISCVPYMLDYGKRGILIGANMNEAVNEILKQLNDNENLKTMSILASKWSQKFTLDVFEKEIVKLLKP